MGAAMGTQEAYKEWYSVERKSVIVQMDTAMPRLVSASRSLYIGHVLYRATSVLDCSDAG